MKMKIRILDLDNCIADDSWRVNKIRWDIEDKEERYKDYHSHCGSDIVANPHLFTGVQVVIFTARPESVRSTTLKWLEKNFIDCQYLAMREQGDSRHSVEVKEDQLKEFFVNFCEADGVHDAFDDREDVVEMYRKYGIIAHVANVHDVCAYTPPKKDAPSKKTVPELLLGAAQTYDERNRVYGDNYKNFGNVMSGMFPAGITIKSADDWNRLGLLVQASSKLTRYASQFVEGGHKDSAHDLINYAAMLEELTE